MSMAVSRTSSMCDVACSYWNSPQSILLYLVTVPVEVDDGVVAGISYSVAQCVLG